MNALQIIPPKPETRARRFALALRVSDGILLLPLLFLLALLACMSMSRGEEGTASESGAAVVLKDSRDNVDDNDKSPSLTQSAAVSAGATMQVSGAGGDDEKMPASSQAAAPTATPASAGVGIDPKVGSDTGQPDAVEAKSDTAMGAEIKDRNAHDRDDSRALAKLSDAPSASAPGNDRVSKSEDGRGRKMAPNARTVRSAESARRASQPRREVDYRSRNAIDGAPVWAGQLPIIYGSGVGARGPYAAVPAQRQDWMASGMTNAWERVVDAPVAVLNGGKHALYGILDSLW